MSKKRLNLDEQVHFQPFQIDNATYDLSHLDAHVVTYTQAADPEKKPITYTFYVTYSHHCFAKDYDHLTKADYERLMYHANRESRPFCHERYELSKQLPNIVKNLPDHLVFHAGYGSYATHKFTNSNGKEIEYFVPFKAYREKKKLRLHFTSAYRLDEPMGEQSTVGFYKIAFALLKNKPLPKPKK